jgi:hypothetical protein
LQFVTTISLYLRRQAVSTLFLCWPPGPPLLKYSTSTFFLSKDIDGAELFRQATVTVEVWTLPFLSVGGTLWKRCPPHSSKNLASSVSNEI